jgi:glycosyltransferase involved in cell wall biosynthesis
VNGGANHLIKKILFFSHICCPTYITGAEKFLLFLISELIKLHKCSLVVPHQGILSQKAQKMGVEIIIQPYPKVTSIWRADPIMHQDVQKMVQNDLSVLINLMHVRNPDLVITNTCINPLPAVAAKKIGISTAWIISEVITQNADTYQSVDLINRYADFIMGISKVVLQPFQRKKLQHKIFTLHPSWRMKELLPASWKFHRQNKRAQFGVHSSHIWIGYISSDIVPLKGLDHFIQMGISLCRYNSNVRLLIVGNATYPMYYADCIKAVQQSGFARRFHFIGFEGDIQKVFPAMDILVVPSLVDEGFGMTAMEGHIFGKPVVSYRSGGLIEINKTTGNEKFLVNKGNIGELANRVKKLVVDKSFREETGKRNQTAVAQAFGIEKYRSHLKRFMDVVNARFEDSKRRIDGMRQHIPSDGVLLKGSSPAVFLLEKGTKRPFFNGDSFYFYKYKWERVILVDDQWLHMYPTGNYINQAGHYIPNSPSQLLVKGSGPRVYLWTGRNLHPIASQSIFGRLKYNFADVVHLPDTIIRALPVGYLIDDQVFKNHNIIDGRLYRTPQGERYYAELHKLRKIASHFIFQFYRWKEEDLISLTTSEFSQLPTGLPIGLPSGLKG